MLQLITCHGPIMPRLAELLFKKPVHNAIRRFSCPFYFFKNKQTANIYIYIVSPQKDSDEIVQNITYP